MTSGTWAREVSLYVACARCDWAGLTDTTYDPEYSTSTLTWVCECGHENTEER